MHLFCKAEGPQPLLSVPVQMFLSICGYGLHLLAFKVLWKIISQQNSTDWAVENGIFTRLQNSNSYLSVKIISVFQSSGSQTFQVVKRLEVCPGHKLLKIADLQAHNISLHAMLWACDCLFPPLLLNYYYLYSLNFLYLFFSFIIYTII